MYLPQYFRTLDWELLGPVDFKTLAHSSFYSFQLLMDQKVLYMSVLSPFFQVKKGIFIQHFCIFCITANNFTISTYYIGRIKPKIHLVSNIL